MHDPITQTHVYHTYISDPMCLFLPLVIAYCKKTHIPHTLQTLESWEGQSLGNIIPFNVSSVQIPYLPTYIFSGNILQ